MSAIDLVRALELALRAPRLHLLRDALEASEADAISSGLAEADALVRESIADRVVVEFPRRHRAAGGALRRPRRYLKLWRQWLAAFDEYELEHSGYEQVGANVLVAVVHPGRGRGSGLPVELPQFQRWVVRDGRVHEIHIYERRDPGASRPAPGQRIASDPVRFEKWQALGNDYVIVERDALPWGSASSGSAHLRAARRRRLRRGPVLAPPQDERHVASCGSSTPTARRPSSRGTAHREAVLYLRAAG